MATPLEQLLALDNDQLLALAKSQLVEVLKGLSEIGMSDKDSAQIVLGLISTAVVSDGTFSAAEKKFIKDLLGTELDDGIVSSFEGTGIVNSIDSIVDTVGEINNELKNSIVMLIICCCIADRDLTDSEIRYLSQIIQ